MGRQRFSAAVALKAPPPQKNRFTTGDILHFCLASDLCPLLPVLAPLS